MRQKEIDVKAALLASKINIGFNSTYEEILAALAPLTNNRRYTEHQGDLLKQLSVGSLIVLAKFVASNARIPNPEYKFGGVRIYTTPSRLDDADYYSTVSLLNELISQQLNNSADALRDNAMALMADARRMNHVITIETRPYRPLRMGYYHMVVDVRPGHKLYRG